MKRITMLLLSALILMFFCSCEKGSDADSSENKDTQTSSINEPAVAANAKAHSTEVVGGVTYIDGILIVNKTYSLPNDYNYGLTDETMEAFAKMKQAAAEDGISLEIVSGFRSYEKQKALYEEYTKEHEKKEADTFSARPGYSEHQSGLAMDINNADFSTIGSKDMEWLAEHCTEYGFIIRFPKGKESITGYSYEPWHIRYVGKDIAKDIKKKNLCLEEYLGVTSKYQD